MEGEISEATAAEPGNFSLESSVSEMAPYSLVCRCVLRAMKKGCMKQTGSPEWNEEDPVFRMSYSTTVDVPVRALKSFAPGVPMWMLRVLVWLANHGHSKRSIDGIEG